MVFTGFECVINIKTISANPKNQPADAPKRVGRLPVVSSAFAVNVDEAWLRLLEEAAARRGVNRVELLRNIVADRLVAERLDLERARAAVSVRESDTELADAT